MDCLMRMQDRCELRCLKIAKIFKVEDLAMSAFVSDQNQLVQVEDISTQKLLKETQQLLRLTGFCGTYFMALCFVYLLQTTIAYFQLDRNTFVDWVRSEDDYGIEMYGLVSTVCLINIVHALTLLSLSFFVVLFTRKFKILNDSHYMQMGILSFLLTVVYFVPIVIVCYYTYTDARDSSTAGHKDGVRRFFDLVVYIVAKSDQGPIGFVFAAMIHFQLYGLLFVMMLCEVHIKDIASKMKKLRDKNAGTYRGLELHDVDDALERQQMSMGAALQEDQQLAAEELPTDLLNTEQQ